MNKKINDLVEYAKKKGYEVQYFRNDKPYVKINGNILKMYYINDFSMPHSISKSNFDLLANALEENKIFYLFGDDTTSNGWSDNYCFSVLKECASDNNVLVKCNNSEFKLVNEEYIQEKGLKCIYD